MISFGWSQTSEIRTFDKQTKIGSVFQTERSVFGRSLYIFFCYITCTYVYKMVYLSIWLVQFLDVRFQFKLTNNVCLYVLFKTRAGVNKGPMGQTFKKSLKSKLLCIRILAKFGFQTVGIQTVTAYSQRPKTERSLWQIEHNCVRFIRSFGFTSLDRFICKEIFDCCKQSLNPL